MKLMFFNKLEIKIKKKMENLTNNQEQPMPQQEEMNTQPEANLLPEAEWCFQFDNEEPVIFAWSNENDPEAVFNLTIPAIEGTAASFKCPNTGKMFTLMVRPISPETVNARKAMSEVQNS